MSERSTVQQYIASDEQLLIAKMSQEMFQRELDTKKFPLITTEINC